MRIQLKTEHFCSAPPLHNGQTARARAGPAVRPSATRRLLGGASLHYESVDYFEPVPHRFDAELLERLIERALSLLLQHLDERVRVLPPRRARARHPVAPREALRKREGESVCGKPEM